jgi:hypothetical protein
MLHEEKYYSWKTSGAAGTIIVYAIKQSQLKEWFSNGPSHEPFETFENWLDDFLRTRKAKRITEKQYKALTAR